MTVWFISDTHFGHANILTFADEQGRRVRPEFASVEEMDEQLVTNWNASVRPSDHIYHLGDVAMRRQDVERIMPRLHGHKRLVRGNHDIFKTAMYYRFFDEIYGSRVLDGMLFTHIPVHPQSLGRFRANIHGHIHERKEYGPGYLNISVERTGYQPLSLEEISARVTP